MKKTKKTTKTVAKKSVKRSPKKTSHSTIYATEHDFIIITGGGLVVLMLTVFLFLQ